MNNNFEKDLADGQLGEKAVAYNKAYAAQGVDGAKAAVDAMLVFETDPVVVDRVQHMMTVQELID